MEGTRVSAAQHEGVMGQISREMVQLYKEQFGRGPTKARSAFAGDDILICTLEDSLTPAERNMVALGEDQRLRDVRLFFQHATEEQFREVVERLTGRKVRAFVSGLDTGQDVSAEVFYFERASVDGGNKDGLRPGPTAAASTDGG
jgi:uncharacterized protein YbcI